MKVMIIGSGGREHALAHFLAKSEKVSQVICVPGSPGISEEPKCHSLELPSYEAMAVHAAKEGMDLVVIGPEGPLVEGLANRFREAGLLVFGPGKKEAELEGSKKFSKAFMTEYGVATAGYHCFDNIREASAHVAEVGGPMVIKASGLCQGKGVWVCEEPQEALTALKDLMEDHIFQEAGSTVIIEEYLTGPEVSILALYDGKDIHPMVSAMDHKRIGEGNTGANTGGMGSIAPAPYYTDEVRQDFMVNILKPTLKGLKDQNFQDPACIFFGLMLTEDGVKLLEYNMRFGDPETQSVLTLLESDLFEVLHKGASGNLKPEDLKFSKDTALCIIGAAPGYPGPFNKGIELTFPEVSGVKVFYAGIKKENGRFLSSGGRIFGATAKGKPKETKELLHRYMERFGDEIIWRRDIGTIALEEQLRSDVD